MTTAGPSPKGVCIPRPELPQGPRGPPPKNERPGLLANSRVAGPPPTSRVTRLQARLQDLDDEASSDEKPVPNHQDRPQTLNGPALGRVDHVHRPRSGPGSASGIDDGMQRRPSKVRGSSFTNLRLVGWQARLRDRDDNEVDEPHVFSETENYEEIPQTVTACCFGNADAESRECVPANQRHVQGGATATRPAARKPRNDRDLPHPHWQRNTMFKTAGRVW